eukprot:g1720.t1
MNTYSTEHGPLILSLQERLSHYISRESVLKQSLDEAEKALENYENDRRKNDEVYLAVEAAKQLLENQMSELHGHLTGLLQVRRMYTFQQEYSLHIKDLNALPIELEKLITGLEDGSLNREAVGGVIVWVEMMIQKSTDSLCKTIEIAEGSCESYSIDKTQQISILMKENEELRKRVLEEEEAIVALQEREVELGTSYNALLAEYEELQHWINQQDVQDPKTHACFIPQTSTGISRDSTPSKEQHMTSRTDSELNNVVTQMSDLQTKIEEAFGGRDRSDKEQQWGSNYTEKAQVDETTETVEEALNKLSSSVSNAKEELEQKGLKLKQNLSKVEKEEAVLRISVDELNDSLSAACCSSSPANTKEGAPQGSTQLENQNSKLVELVINITELDLKHKESNLALEKVKRELEDARKRLEQYNVRHFNADVSERSVSCAKQLEYLDYRGLEQCNFERMPVKNKDGTKDDFWLNLSPVKTSIGCSGRPDTVDSQFQLPSQASGGSLSKSAKKNAKQLEASKEEISRLNNMCEFERFVLSEQELLLQQNHQETERLVIEHQELIKQVNFISKELEDQQKLMEQHKREHEQLQSLKEATLQQLKQTNEDICSIGGNLDALEQNKALITHQLSERQKELQQLQYTNKDREESLFIMTKKLADQEDECQRLVSFKEKLLVELENSKADYDESEKQKETIRITCNKHKAELANKVSEGKALMEEIKDLTKQKAKLEYALENLTKECNILKEIKQRKQAALDTLEQTIWQQENQKTSLLKCTEHLPQETNEKREAEVHEMHSCERSPRHVAGVSEKSKHKLWSRSSASRNAQTSGGILQVKSNAAPDHEAFERDIVAEAKKTDQLIDPENQNSPDKGYQEEIPSLLNTKFPDVCEAHVDSYGSASGDLLIRCLETELRKQQETNEQQSIKIKDLEKQMSLLYTSSSAYDPIKTLEATSIADSTRCITGESRDPPPDGSGVLQLQAALKQALNDMDKLYERVTSITELGEEVQDSIQSMNLGSPEMTSPRSQSPTRSNSGHDSKSRRSTLVLKTRGQASKRLVYGEFLPCVNKMKACTDNTRAILALSPSLRASTKEKIASFPSYGLRLHRTVTEKPRSPSTSFNHLSPFALSAIAPPSEESLTTTQDDVSTEKFNWFKNWWAVQAVANLETDRPNKIKLLGKDFIVWKGHIGDWIAMDDECPHRMAPLSEGRIEKDGNLLCSYHAWRFNESGKCVKIPHAEDEKAHTVACNSPRSAVQTYPCKTRGAVLWIWPDNSVSAFSDSEKTPVPISDDLADYAERSHEDGSFVPYFEILPASYEASMENGCDPSHFHSAHHGAFPILNRDSIGPINARFAEETCKERGYYVMEYESPHHLNDAKIELDLPGKCTMFHRSVALGNRRERNELFVSPMSATETSVVMFILLEEKIENTKKANIFQRTLSPIANMSFHLILLSIIDSDILITSAQGRKTSVQGFNSSRDFYTPTNADILIMAFRKWFENEGNHGAAFGGDQPIDQNQYITREQVLNRYESHTKHCKTCSSALKIVERLIPGLKFLRLIAVFAGTALIYKLFNAGPVSTVSVLKNAPIIVSVLALVLSTVAVFLLTKLRAQFYHIDYVFADKN